MDDTRPVDAEEIITSAFVKTLLPFFSWCCQQLCSALFGCKLTLVLFHPTSAYIDKVKDSWINNNQLFSCAEILSFQTASGRQRCRKKLKKILSPLFRELKRSREIRLRFQEQWYRLAEKIGGVTPEIPRNSIKKLDIAEMEKKIDKEFSSFSSEDIFDTFPLGKTVEPRLVKLIKSEVGDYGQTVQSLWWEASRDWNLIRRIGIKKNSGIWALLGVNPDDEPDMDRLIDIALGFFPGEVNDEKVARVARWVMGRILISHFIESPYSEKQKLALETPVADNLSLGQLLPDKETLGELEQLEERSVLDNILELLPASQREACIFFLQAGNLGKTPDEMRRELGDKKYEAKQRNYERALKHLRDLRKSGRLSQ